MKGKKKERKKKELKLLISYIPTQLFPPLNWSGGMIFRMKKAS